MKNAVLELDRLLRGDATRVRDMRNGILEIDCGGLAVIIMLLGMFYGLCMGCFGLAQNKASPLPQLLAATGKVPLLFLLTLIVTFPSLYVFNALVGSRLTMASTLRLIVAALAIMLAVLASLGTIVAFFSVSTTDYHFMLIFNVLVFSVSGALGMKFLLQTLHRLTVAQEAEDFADSVMNCETAIQSEGALAVGALDKVEDQAVGDRVTAIFRIWVVVFGLVGAQMAWVLRPFIGSPHMEFALFRTRESSFFEAVGHALLKLIS